MTPTPNIPTIRVGSIHEEIPSLRVSRLAADTFDLAGSIDGQAATELQLIAEQLARTASRLRLSEAL